MTTAITDEGLRRTTGGLFVGSTSWGLWIAALGVVILLRPARSQIATQSGAPAGSASIPAPRPSVAADVSRPRR